MIDADQAAAQRRRTARDWLAAADDLVGDLGTSGARDVLAQVRRRAAWHGVDLAGELSTPYVNTLDGDDAFQSSELEELELERRIESWVRWNAVAMVVRANRRLPGIGGHVSTYASAATLFEVGFNHCFRGAEHAGGKDQIFFQGHASPGVYARAFLEGRLSEAQLDGFRRELGPGAGLPSYPHPWSMPDFWQFPSVSMGLAPITAIYQARFNRYLEARGLASATGRVWALLGDGEMDEPEAVGALGVAGRERLDNLIFVVNCNLQRLDGPVRGNGKIIQELESLFLGAGWRVIKVVWSSAWDPLLARDRDGFLLARMEEVIDGDYQRYAAEGSAHLREHFFGVRPELQALAGDLSQAQWGQLHYGGHDPAKVLAAYRAAERESERPTAVLCKTVKGWGLGSAYAGRNATHKAQVLDEDELLALRDRLEVPIDDDRAAQAALCKPAEDSPELRHLRERRRALGGWLPAREDRAEPLDIPGEPFERQCQGSGEREATTTVSIMRLLGDLLRDEQLGPRIVPIVPDEARTFGLEALFPRIGIYSPQGQRYEPVDAGTLLAYRELPDGQILEEGITEAGSLASTIAAGTAHATHGLTMLPFYFFYSMFGFQRVGDLVWAAQDGRTRGFLIGATAGRTTLQGEGLQHQDGHSQLLAFTHPRVRAYDPAFAYELALIVRHGLERIAAGDEDALFYLTVYNEPCVQPPLPEGCEEGVLRGLYRFCGADGDAVKILASGTAIHAALRARERLAEEFDVAASVWSATSYQALHRDALAAQRWNRFHPSAERRVPWIEARLGAEPGPVVALSDFVKALPCTLGAQLGPHFVPLGTDGFGRSDGRAELREYFEVSERHVTFAALSALDSAGELARGRLAEALTQLEIEPQDLDPAER